MEIKHYSDVLHIFFGFTLVLFYNPRYSPMAFCLYIFYQLINLLCGEKIEDTLMDIGEVSIGIIIGLLAKSVIKFIMLY